MSPPLPPQKILTIHLPAHDVIIKMDFAEHYPSEVNKRYNQLIEVQSKS